MLTESDKPITLTGTTVSPQSIEQYKAKLSDLGNLGNRQASMTTYYVSIVSALLGLLAFKERSIADIDTTILSLVCVTGFLVCLLWFFSLTFFRSLFRAKLTVLTSIESSLPHQTFQQEFDIMRQSSIYSWIWIERLVPVVFGLLFFSIATVRIVRLIAHN